MPMRKGAAAKGVKIGRSVEEVIVLRKLEASDPNSWPNAEKKRKLLTSNSMFAYTPHTLGGVYNSKSNGISNGAHQTINLSAQQREAARVAESEAKDETIRSLVEYCQTLQNHVKVCNK